MVASGRARHITQLDDFLPASGLLGADTVHQGHGGHAFRGYHTSSRQSVHIGERTLAVGVQVLLQGYDPQPCRGEGRNDLAETPPEQVAAVRVLEVPLPFDETSRRETALRFRDVVAHAFFE